MSEQNLPRPRQVTMAGWMIVLGSVLAIVGVWDQVTRLRSLDTRTAVEETLSQPPLSGFDLSVGQVLDVMHVLSLVTGACAAAAVVLGWQAMQRQRTARLALTVLAVPLLLAGMGGGGFFTTLVAVSVLLLWLQPARDWFAGVAPREPATDPRAAEGRPGRTKDLPAYPTAPEEPSQPRATAGFGAAAYGSAAPAPDRRPGALTAAAVITWVFCGLTTGLMVVFAGLVLADPQALLDEALRQTPELAGEGLTAELLRASSLAMAGFVVVWCVVASVMAALALRRKAWARTTWVVLVAVAAGGLLLSALMSALAAVPMVAAMVTLSLLARPESRIWYARERRLPPM